MDVVKVRRSEYRGRTVYKPANDLGKMICEVSLRSALSLRMIETLKKWGYQVKDTGGLPVE